MRRGHAVAYIQAFRALGRHWQAFHRVVIRPHASGPYLNRRGVDIDCLGICEGPHLCNPAFGLDVFNLDQGPEWRSMMLRQMEWEIIVALAGPFATAAHHGVRSKAGMKWAAALSGGGQNDYKRAESVLADYRKATRRRLVPSGMWLEFGVARPPRTSGYRVKRRGQLAERLGLW